jgi:hypothetical protein
MSRLQPDPGSLRDLLQAMAIVGAVLLIMRIFSQC